MSLSWEANVDSGFVPAQLAMCMKLPRKETKSGVARVINEASFFGTSFSYPGVDELRGVLF